MIRRLSLAVALLATLGVLTGCAPFLGAVQQVLDEAGTAPLLPAPTTSAAPVTAVPFEPGLHVGTCLDGVVGADADRDAQVGCNRPHEYDVVGLETWPEMDDALEGTSATKLYAELQRGNTERAQDYWTWAGDACGTALRRALGWEDDALGEDYWTGAVDDIDVWPAGAFVIDASFARRAAFVGGDRTTLCSVRWSDPSTGSLSVRDSYGRSVAHYFDPEFPVETRYCHELDGTSIGCDEPHAYQELLNFDAVRALGQNMVEDAREDLIAGGAAQLLVDSGVEYCTELIATLLPQVDVRGGLVYALFDDSWSDASYPTEDYDWYLGCGVGPTGARALVTGDLFSP